MSSFKVTKTDPLFSTPLCLLEIQNSAKLNKKLIAESRAWRKQEKGANISNQGDSWHSPDGLMSRSDPGFSKIRGGLAILLLFLLLRLALSL